MKPPKPPGDPMRLVMWIAGGIAGLIALAAIGLGVSERFARPEPVASGHRFSEPYVLPPVVDASAPAPPATVAPPKKFPGGPLTFVASAGSCFGNCVEHTTTIDASAPAPPATVAPPKKFPSGPLTFVASAGSCFGNCVEHTTTIDADGRVKLTMSRLRGAVCPPADGPKISAADLAALADHARSIHMEQMSDNYVRGTDVQGMRTEVSNGTETLSIVHLGTEDAPDAGAWRHEAAAIYDLHEQIERLAGTEQWVKTCKRTQTRKPVGPEALVY